MRLHTLAFAASLHLACGLSIIRDYVLQENVSSSSSASSQTPGKEAEEVKDWWDKHASENFQHLDRDYVTKHMQDWNAFLPKFEWSKKKVLDYGIGAGYLGETLLRDHSIGTYVGVDISQKALDAATKVLASWSPQVQLLLTPQSFRQLAPEVVVSQQVIQHFPSVSYFEEFLSNVDASGAAELMLQFRKSSDGSTESNHAYTTGGDAPKVAMGLVTTDNFIAQHLPHYELVWSSLRSMCCGTHAEYTGWKLKR